jgi:hypothetical protein
MMIRKAMPYGVELDGCMTICDEGRLQSVNGFHDLRGSCRMVTDMQGAISGTMTVEADIRYAELMIARKLQETGEFDEPVTVISHWKQKHAGNITEVLYTAVPSKRYLQYQELVTRNDAHLVLIPLQSVLYDALRKLCRKGPVAVVFQHDRFADLIVGTRKRVWFAGRAVAFDRSEEQIQGLWDTVYNDIRSVANENNQVVEVVYVATWVDSSPLPQWPESGDCRLLDLPQTALMSEGHSVDISLPGLIQAARTGSAPAPFKEKLLYAARRALPYLNMLLLAGALVFAAGGMWYKQQSARFTREMQVLRQRAMEIKTTAPSHIEPLAYDATVNFIQQLWSSQQLPTYRQVLTDFSQGPDTPLRLVNLKADYTDRKVEIDAFGIAEAAFDVSYKAYQQLLHQLHRRGYTVVEKRFDTSIRNSNFTVHLTKEIQ